MEKDFQQANLFELSSGGIQVMYSSSSITGSPLLNYRDDNRNCQFNGEEIRSAMTEIGQMLTVTLEQTLDLSTVTFTMILPVVTVSPTSPATHMEVPGITSTTRMAIAGPVGGPEKMYSQVNLKGTAQVVVF